MSYALLRPLIFRLTRHNPELAHTLALVGLGALGRVPPLLRLLAGPRAAGLERELFGLRFANPVGLAAGYDKDGLALPALAALGFGHIEVGTVTWHAQPGNPRPRLFRLPADGALINRMGFNNRGALALAQRLRQLPARPVPLGISLGKSRRTTLENAIHDYRASLRLLYPYGDYFAINISSPNTPGLRALQGRDQLETLLAALQREARQLAHETDLAAPRPLLVKVSPDLSDGALLDVIEVCTRHQISGMIATNTTLSRAGLRQPVAEPGGLSGPPLAARACQVIHFIGRETAGRLPIIGVGGIASGDDALRMLAAGASLVQVYTGLIYRGPGLVHEINRACATAAH